MIPIEHRDDELRFDVRVTPKAKRAKIGGRHADALRVAVTSPPEDGKANAAVIQGLAKFFKIAKSNISICSGQASRCKRIAVRSMTETELRDRLRDVIDA
ncbi:DUF167 domain-containing protein [Crateriforma conspicua]|uniref:DUF167 domain-containing protein n=1 Tax=Crateriforma conspicua TaxID=2527996 RepID=UPI00118B688B|nr:DUF167 domain-containing protein [Crateriforma conspicua]QDV61900.1 hypothetical protein Mal65_10270 [Crateriforma conspicua]